MWRRYVEVGGGIRLAWWHRVAQSGNPAAGDLRAIPQVRRCRSGAAVVGGVCGVQCAVYLCVVGGCPVTQLRGHVAECKDKLVECNGRTIRLNGPKASNIPTHLRIRPEHKLMHRPAA